MNDLNVDSGTYTDRSGMTFSFKNSLTFHFGQITTFYGVNGSGKSTLLRSLATRAAGKYDLIGYLPQDYDLLTMKWLKKGDIYKIFGGGRSPILGEEYVRSLSNGQRQTLALEALLSKRDKSILFLDEPFSALDAEKRREKAIELKELSKQKQFTVFLIEHEPSTVQFISDQILFFLNKSRSIGVLSNDVAISEESYRNYHIDATEYAKLNRACNE